MSTLTHAATQFNRYTPMPVFILGLLGNTFNMFIFTRRALRKNPCSVYLFSATCMNMNVLFFGLLIRSLMDGFDIDIIGSSLVLCRLRYIILHPSYTLSSWFVVLASIDRYCVSSRYMRLRSISRLSVAYRVVAVAVCVCFLMYVHVLGLFEIEQLPAGPYCYAKVGLYRVVYDFLFFGSFSGIPPILMVIIGCATVRNICFTRVRIQTMRPATLLRQLSKKDRQLIWLLLVQIVATIICTVPHAVQKLYSTFTLYESKSPLRVAVENLATQITRQLLYINASMSFYLYVTSSSSVFRHEFRTLMNKIIIRIFGNHRCTRRLVRKRMKVKNTLNRALTVEETIDRANPNP